jgi:hypothetical protein
MGVAEDDEVIEAFPSNRADQPLRNAHSARVTAGPSGDRVCPWLQDAGDRMTMKRHGRVSRMR